MGNELEVAKPSFNGEIQARIKSLGEIESNINEVKEFAINLKNYYNFIVFDEESMKVAKEEKAKVNKFKDKISSYRKDIIKQWKEPVEQFEITAKEVEQILTETYGTINEQCSNYENAKKEEKRQILQDYFNDLQKVYNYDMISFEDVGLNITLSSSEKALKEQMQDFFNKIHADLDLIDTQEHKAEIMVEYKKNGFDVSTAIVSINNLHKQLEEEQKRLEEKAKERQEEQKQFIASNLTDEINVEEEEFTPPTEIPQPFEVEPEPEPETFIMTFTVKGTKEQLTELKHYLEERNLISDEQ